MPSQTKMPAEVTPVIIGSILVYDTDPVNLIPSGWYRDEIVWLNSSKGRFYKRVNDTWEAVTIPPEITMDEELAAALALKADVSHSHPTHGDINFTGSVSADGDAGLTGQRTVGGYKLTFKKGLLVGFEQV